MRTFCLLLVLSISACVLQAATPAPTIDASSVVIAQDPANRKVTISYTLQQADAVVTVSVLTNGVPIPGAALTNMTGGAFTYQQMGTHTLMWDPTSTWPDQVLTNSELSVKVTAYSIDRPPDYLVVDLAASNREPNRYYPSAEEVPLGVTHALYKTDRLLMRRIHAAGHEAVLGAPEWETGYNAYPQISGDNTVTSRVERCHLVVFTNDYYIGVYPFTQQQYIHLAGTNSSSRTSMPDHLYAPAENVSYADLNGQSRAADYRTLFPAPTSLLGVLRSRTGILFDLPLSDQWEYACRAGVGTSIYTGWNVTGSNSDDQLKAAAWFAGNANNTTHPVGLKTPNNWGLYDMLGNVEEWLVTDINRLRWEPPAPGTIVGFPPNSGNDWYETRGGHYASDWPACRAAYKCVFQYTTRRAHIGFRVVCPAQAQ